VPTGKEMKFIKLAEVIEKTSLKKSSIYAFMAEGKFPKNIKLGERAVAWDADLIDSWMLAKVESSNHQISG